MLLCDIIDVFLLLGRCMYYSNSVGVVVLLCLFLSLFRVFVSGDNENDE